ncbi:MAG TPA: GlsB/YeaQ/YmgE family stress response membrane protein [Methylomirabilota bacterium]|nr:GlsB/YeaQ/YmgE family stress response membrane protein [Methylomirabilota bacterium]
MNLLLWIIFGALVGWISSIVMKTDDQQGGLMNIIIGMIGAALGGFLMNLFRQPGVTGFNFYSLFVALLGSIMFLWMYRALTHRNI